MPPSKICFQYTLNCQQLHHKWYAGMTVGGAIRAGRRMGLVGLAALFSTIVAIDGPLLQKATTIDLAPIVAPPMPLNVTMAQELLTDSTGEWNKDGAFGIWSVPFNATVPTLTGGTPNVLYSSWTLKQFPLQNWFYNESAGIEGVVHGCSKSSTCNTTVRAPALALSACVPYDLEVDYWRPVASLKNMRELTGVAPPLSTNAFLIDVDLILDNGTERINLITGYSRTQNCSGIFEYTICTLDSGK